MIDEVVTLAEKYGRYREKRECGRRKRERSDTLKTRYAHASSPKGTSPPPNLLPSQSQY